MLLHLGLIFQTLAGAGYQYPVLTAAPGQVIPLLVTGLQTVLPPPGTLAAQKVPLPTNLGGISVTLRQTLPDRSWQLPIFAIRQSNHCDGVNMTAACLVTALTLQMPYDMTVPNLLAATPVAQSDSTLVVSEGGVSSQTFQVQAVHDRVHIIQSCDIGGQTYGTGVCYPLVTHADGSLVQQDIRSSSGEQTHTEAQPGETLVMYAYGLGAVNTAVPLGDLSPNPAAVAAEMFSMRYDYSPNAGPSMPGNSQYLLPVFAGLTPGQIGLYQVNFVVPRPPPGTAPCGSPVQSNLTVSILALSSGSFDGASICVDPGTAAP